MKPFTSLFCFLALFPMMGQANILLDVTLGSNNDGLGGFSQGPPRSGGNTPQRQTAFNGGLWKRMDSMGGQGRTQTEPL